MKKLFLLNILLILGITSAAIAQEKDIKDLYMDYSVARMDPDSIPRAISTALALLNRSSELNEKQIANVNFHLGRIYETNGAADKAIPYYEQAIKLSPGYYVTYRALGYINLRKCDTLGRKVSESVKLKNVAMNQEAYKAYKIQVQKTIAYFEKSQACEPDDDNLNILKSLYTGIKDTTLLTTLPDRLTALGKDCITLLDDE